MATNNTNFLDIMMRYRGFNKHEESDNIYMNEYNHIIYIFYINTLEELKEFVSSGQILEYSIRVNHFILYYLDKLKSNIIQIFNSIISEVTIYESNNQQNINLEIIVKDEIKIPPFNTIYSADEIIIYPVNTNINNSILESIRRFSTLDKENDINYNYLDIDDPLVKYLYLGQGDIIQCTHNRGIIMRATSSTTKYYIVRNHISTKLNELRMMSTESRRCNCTMFQMYPDLFIN